jgi:hypothetical protein
VDQHFLVGSPQVEVRGGRKHDDESLVSTPIIDPLVEAFDRLFILPQEFVVLVDEDNVHFVPLCLFGFIKMLGIETLHITTHTHVVVTDLLDPFLVSGFELFSAKHDSGGDVVPPEVLQLEEAQHQQALH